MGSEAAGSTAASDSATGSPRVMLVTGASRGIGAATARLAAGHGFAVGVNFATRGDAADAVVADITAAGGRAVAIQADVAVEADVLAMFATVDRELGPLESLVNNAGSVGQYGAFATLDVAQLRAMLDVNVVGAFLCAREAVRRMSTASGGRGGTIINVSSQAAVLGGVGEWVWYAASKGAIDTMTTGLAKELGPQGIRVNAVRPGLIDTDIHDAAPPGRIERLLPGVPLGRAGTAEEVAEAIVWLAADAPAYVTGAFVPVSGGRL
jgi:NAD(P)-dependent dehydrogenase (short-subunit alcohol dehydrogenase family)